MGLQTRRKLASLGPIFAFDAPSPTGSGGLRLSVRQGQQGDPVHRDLRMGIGLRLREPGC
jgi:hypothetical protein